MFYFLRSQVRFECTVCAESVQNAETSTDSCGNVIFRLKKKPNFNLFIFLGGPTFVDLGIYINSFYDISEQTMVSKTLHSYPLHPSPLFPPSEHPQ